MNMVHKPIYLDLDNYKDFTGKIVIDRDGNLYEIRGCDNPLVFDYPIVTTDGKRWSQDQLHLVT